eukprot:11200420-Lingulodinium_polyedra.AAC.1
MRFALSADLVKRARNTSSSGAPRSRRPGRCAGGRATSDKPLKPGHRRMRPCGRCCTRYPTCTTPCMEKLPFSGEGPEFE